MPSTSCANQLESFKLGDAVKHLRVLKKEGGQLLSQEVSGRVGKDTDCTCAIPIPRNRMKKRFFEKSRCTKVGKGGNTRTSAERLTRTA